MFVCGVNFSVIKSHKLCCDIQFIYNKVNLLRIGISDYKKISLYSGILPNYFLKRKI